MDKEPECPLKYVYQVHLKNSNSPALDGKLFAIRKSDLKRFQPDVDFIDEEVEENPCRRLDSQE